MRLREKFRRIERKAKRKLKPGTRANVRAVNALRSLVPEYYVVGDARRASKVMMAVRDAYDAVVDMAL